MKRRNGWLFAGLGLVIVFVGIAAVTLVRFFRDGYLTVPEWSLPVILGIERSVSVKFPAEAYMGQLRSAKSAYPGDKVYDFTDSDKTVFRNSVSKRPLKFGLALLTTYKGQEVFMKSVAVLNRDGTVSRLHYVFDRKMFTDAWGKFTVGDYFEKGGLAYLMPYGKVDKCIPGMMPVKVCEGYNLRSEKLADDWFNTGVVSKELSKQMLIPVRLSW